MTPPSARLPSRRPLPAAIAERLDALLRDHPDEEGWAALRAHLDDFAPSLVEEAERRLATGDLGDPNAGAREVIAVGIGLASLARGALPSERYDVFLRAAVESPPEEGDSIVGHGPLLAALVEILRALPLARREAVVVQDRFDGLLCWSLARLAAVRTPRVAERAAWKLADLAHRRNGGGTYTDVTLRREELALFAMLGEVAVPALVDALGGAAPRADFLLQALGQTRCAAALRPLCACLGGGAATHRAIARDAVAEVVRAIGDGAALDALAPLLREPDRTLRAGAAGALALLPAGEGRRAVVADAAATERDATVKAALASILRAPAEPAALARWRALRAAWGARVEAEVRAAREAAPHAWRDELLRGLDGWSDEQVAVTAALTFLGYAEGAEGYHDAFLVASALRSRRAPPAALGEVLPWALLDAVDQYRWDFVVQAAVEESAAWLGRRPREALRHAIGRAPRRQEALVAALKAAAPHDDDDLDAFVAGLRDGGAKVRRLCADALAAAGDRAAEKLRAAAAGERRAKARSALAEALARCEAATAGR